MPTTSSSLRRGIITAALLPLVSMALSACGTPTAVPKPIDVPTNVPTAVSKVPDTLIPPPVATTTVAQPSDGSTTNTGNTGSTGTDSSTWPQVQRSAQGTTYSYHYPPGWSPDLSYCAPGAARSASGSQLPAGCASTDILVGQKARDVGTLTGQNITLDGKQAVKQIDRAPRNGQADLIYTVLIYDPSGEPVAGFSTTVGPGTATATANNIVSMLDQIASTLVVSKQ